MNIRQAAIAIGAILVVTASASVGAPSNASAQEIPKGNAPAPTLVVAKVNGTEILLSDIEAARNLLPPKLQTATLQEVYPVLVEALVNARIAAQQADADGLMQSSEYVRRMKSLSEKVLERMLLTRYIKKNLTEDLVLESYMKLVEAVKEEFEINARHILLSTEEEAEKVIKLLDDGDDFGTLAKALSQGPSSKNGGNLGWFSQGRMVPAFEKAIFDLAVGEVTPSPIQTQFGWHVIMVEGRRPTQVKPFQDARSEIVNKLSAQLGRKFIKSLREASNIKMISYEELVKKIQ